MKSVFLMLLTLLTVACATAPTPTLSPKNSCDQYDANGHLRDWHQGLTQEQIEACNEEQARKFAQEWAKYCAEHPCRSHPEFNQMWQDLQPH